MHLGAVKHRQDKQPADASDLGEAGSYRLGRSQQLMARAQLRQWTAKQPYIACRL